MSVARRSAALLVAFIITALVAVPVFAQDSRWESVEYVLHDEGEESILIVSGTLPESTQLPAQVSLAVPTGAELLWVGEILGGPVSEDPSVQAAKTTEDGLDIYSFSLSKSRIGQLEVTVAPPAAEGTAVSPAIALTAHQDVPEVRVGVRVPQGSTVVQGQTGAEMSPGPQGYSYYAMTVNDVKQGDPIELAFTYSAPAQAPAQTPTQSGASETTSSVVVPIVLLLVVVAVGAALVLKVSAKMGNRGGDINGSQVVEAASSDSSDSSHQAPAQVTDESQSSSDQSDDGENAVATRRSLTPIMIAVGVIAVIVVAFTVVGQSTRPQSVDGTFTRQYPGVGACTSADLKLTPAPGVDLAKDGNKLVDSLAGVESVGNVTLYVADQRITIEYCESSTNEEQLKQTLGSTGLVTW